MKRNDVCLVSLVLLFLAPMFAFAYTEPIYAGFDRDCDSQQVGLCADNCTGASSCVYNLYSDKITCGCDVSVGSGGVSIPESLVNETSGVSIFDAAAKLMGSVLVLVVVAVLVLIAFGGNSE